MDADDARPAGRDGEELRALEEVVEAFARTLPGEEAARGRIRLFLLHYLHGHAGIGLSEVGPSQITDFVGTWMIRHVANVTEETIRSTTAALISFFRWRARSGGIADPDLEEILRACKNDEFFLARLEEYRRSVDDEDAFEIWLEKRWGWVDVSGPVDPQVLSPPAADPDLVQAIASDPLPALAEDFCGLLTAIRETPLRLIRSGLRLTGSAVTALNRRLPDPDPLPRRPRQEHSPRVNAAYSAASGLGLCGPGTGGRVRALPHLDSVLGMEDRERYALLLDALWNRVRWRDLVPRSGRAARSGVHEGRAWLARILAVFPVGEEVAFTGRIPGPRRRLASILHGEAGFIRCLVPVLARGGLWRGRLAERRDRAHAPTRLLSLSITRIGHEVLKVWAKDAAAVPPPPPFDRVLEEDAAPPRSAPGGPANGTGNGGAPL